MITIAEDCGVRSPSRHRLPIGSTRSLPPPALPPLPSANHRHIHRLGCGDQCDGCSLARTVLIPGHFSHAVKPGCGGAQGAVREPAPAEMPRIPDPPPRERGARFAVLRCGCSTVWGLGWAGGCRINSFIRSIFVSPGQSLWGVWGGRKGSRLADELPARGARTRSSGGPAGRDCRGGC